MEERLHKVLARAGIASRRKAEEMIEQGRVMVNGEVVTELGARVDPAEDEVRVDGERVRLEGFTEKTFMLYKPRGVVTTASDEFGRQTVIDLVPAANQVRLFPVGRLDLESEGLILLTNNGELANRLTHPRYEHEKEYRVNVYGTPSEENLQRLRDGIYLEDGKTLPAQITVDRVEGENAWLRVVLREGRKRQIRRMFEIIGHPVRRLLRVRMGPLELGALKPGEYRELTEEEQAALASGRRRPLSEGRRGRKPGWARPKARTTRPGRPSSRGGGVRHADEQDRPTRKPRSGADKPGRRGSSPSRGKRRRNE